MTDPTMTDPLTDNALARSALARLLPEPGRRAHDQVDLAIAPAEAWQAVRHADLSESHLVRGLFALRTLPARLGGSTPADPRLRLDDLVSTPERPGFTVLVDDAPREVVVGAVGQVRGADISFAHVSGPQAFAAFAEPGFVKIAWAVQVARLGQRDSSVRLEVRFGATDAESWHHFRRYLMLVGPVTRLMRRWLLWQLGRRHGTPRSMRNELPLPGDDLLPDAIQQLTHAVAVHADPEDVWPWLVQVGRHRAGFYGIDLLDNGGRRSAREIHAELQELRVGDLVPVDPRGDQGFEVLQVDPGRALVLGGLYDAESGRQVPYGSPRPERFWQMTWSLALEPLQPGRTRLSSRTRRTFGPPRRRTGLWVRPVHAIMQRAQLRHIGARAAGRLGRDDWRDVLEGVAGAALMAAGLLTPFLRDARSRWGTESGARDRDFPGDALVPEPRWGWTHGIEIQADAADVWPWIAQMGADRGGFYSYQWLENVVGCRIRNAETVHPEWTVVRPGDGLVLHPKMPPLSIAGVEPGRYLLAFASPEADEQAAGGSWVAASWLFHLEPLGPGRCRLVSRYRCATSDDRPTRLLFGPALVEPIGFAMDRRMLIGVKQRAERRPTPTRTG